jgi:hypothetical protein
MLMPYYIGLVLTIFLQEWSKINWLMSAYLSIVAVDIVCHLIMRVIKK